MRVVVVLDCLQPERLARERAAEAGASNARRRRLLVYLEVRAQRDSSSANVWS